MKSWRRDPDEWDRLTPDARAQMMAFDMVESAREAYRSERQADEMDPKKKDKATGSNAYERQKRMMGIG